MPVSGSSVNRQLAVTCVPGVCGVAGTVWIAARAGMREGAAVCVSDNQVLLNPAGFEPRIPPVSGPVCRL
jgi:hypothetical protein